MTDSLAAVCLGIVEGVTEFLPISSTGHLLLAEHWLGARSDLFNTVIQSGAVLAVLMVFGARIKSLALQWRNADSRDYICKLAVAFGITGAGGLALKHFHFRLPETTAPIALATLIGGLLFLMVETWLKGRALDEAITWRIAMIVGLAQLVAAAFPGASRSGVTILAAIVLGASRRSAAEFSFLLGIPTLLSASVLQIWEATRHSDGAAPHWGDIGLASVVALLTAFVTVKWLLRYVQTHTFVWFGWYRIAVGLATLAFLR